MKRRFIAGAKCPKCNAQDRIVLFTTVDDEWIGCVECDYTDRRPTAEDLEQLHQQAAQATDEIGVVQFKPFKPH